MDEMVAGRMLGGDEAQERPFDRGALLWRRAKETDAGAIRALSREAYAKWVPLIGREPWPMSADYTETITKHRFDLLYRDGELVALVEMIIEADHVLVENVAVRPAHQGHGLGHRLMARAEETTRELGHSLIKLYTNKLFAENVRFYLKLGYRIDREETWAGGEIIRMSKAI